MTFLECVHACAANRELLSEFDRLNGTNLSLKGAPIELMVDEASGRLADDVADFVAFVAQCIWLPMARAERAHENTRIKDVA